MSRLEIRICPQCGKEFEGLEGELCIDCAWKELKEIDRVNQQTLKHEKCPICGKKVGHGRHYGPNGGPYYYCECGFFSPRYSDLKKHLDFWNKNRGEWKE